MVTIIDATGLVIGRLSSHVAKRLLKEKQLEVHIVNAEKAIVSGERKRVLGTYQNKRRLNHYRKGPYFPRQPHRILKRTVRGMLPYQTSHGRDAFKRLKVHIGIPKEFEKTKKETVDGAKNQNLEKYLELGEISKVLGAKF